MACTLLYHFLKIIYNGYVLIWNRKEEDMKKNTLICTLTAVLLLFLGLLNPYGIHAGESVKYSCSNQVYQTFDKQKIEAFYHKTGIEVDVVVSSSASARRRLMRGFSQIASTAQRLEVLGNNAEYNQISLYRDPMAVIARSECGVSDISEAQLQDIFAGRISNWKELGGADLPILVVIPGVDTAVYENFTIQIMKGKRIDYDFMAYDSTMAIEAVKHFPCGTISFITRGAVIKEPEIETIKINGLLPVDHEYPYFQEFYYVTKGKPSDLVKAFIDFSFSDEGRNIMQQKGVIPSRP